MLHMSERWFRLLERLYPHDFRDEIGAERARPAASWRRAGDWGRDVELVRRRLVRSPVFAATTIGTLSIGLGMFAVV
jgi:hypothetical protein